MSYATRSGRVVIISPRRRHQDGQRRDRAENDDPLLHDLEFQRERLFFTFDKKIEASDDTPRVLLVNVWSLLATP